MAMSAKLEKYENQEAFDFNGQLYRIKKTGSMAVAEGVVCDTYSVGNHEDIWDLGIIKIQPGCKTPRQIVRSGEKTFEGILEGAGTLSLVWGRSNTPEMLPVDSDVDDSFMRVMRIGDTMQWIADKDVPLVVYEMCWPPYQEDRFEDLPD